MPESELDRLGAVHRFLNFKINKEAELQEIVELAAELCETPMAVITLMDKDTLHLKYKTGTNRDQLTLSDTFCQYLLEGEELLIVPDALMDDRFSKNPSVVKGPHIRFYAGAPLVTHDGHRLGSICVLGTVPKTLTDGQQHLLKVMARRVTQFMEFEFSIAILKQQFLRAKESENKLLAFFESSVSYHMLLGMDHDVVAFNKNIANFVEKMLAVKLYEGIQINQVLKGEGLELYEQNYERALSGVGVRLERRIEYANGEIYWWDVVFDPAYGSDGEIIGVSYNATDITERKIHEQEILAKNHSLQQIAHIQSHEFRKPIASILGLINIFKAEGYKATAEELKVLERAAEELDYKIRAIVALTDG